MEMIVVGVNHRTAPVNLRERLSFSKNEIPGVLHQLTDSFNEVIVLSTCNRTEIYTVVDDPCRGYTQLAQFLASIHDTPQHTILPHLYCLAGENAAHHLFSVAAGADSMIPGEPQILGQVRTAFMQAQTAETVGKYLSLVFRCALHAGKRVRTETRIAQGVASISQAAVELMRSLLDSIETSHLAIIGAGEMGQQLTQCFKDAGCRRFTIASHDTCHAQELANLHSGATAAPLSALYEVLLMADAALTSLAAPAPVITPALAAQLSQRRNGKPLFIVDLAVPRNVDADVRNISGIQVFDIDDLYMLVQATMKLRLQEMEHLEDILDEEMGILREQWRSMSVAPLISALCQKAEAIRQSEMQKALPKLHALSEKELNIVQALTSRIVKKLLHEPISTLRAQEDSTQADCLRTLFSLNIDTPAESEYLLDEI